MKKAAAGLLVFAVGCNDVPFAPDPEINVIVLNEAKFFWPGDTILISSPSLPGVELVPLDQNDFSTVGPWQNASATLGDSTSVPLFKLDDSTLAIPIGSGQAGLLDLVVRLDSTTHQLTPVTVGGILGSEDLPDGFSYALMNEPGEIIVAGGPPNYTGLAVGKLGDPSITWVQLSGDYLAWTKSFGPSVYTDRVVVSSYYGARWLSVSIATGEVDTLPCLGYYAVAELGGGHCASVWDNIAQIDDSLAILGSTLHCLEDDYFEASGNRKYFALLSDPNWVVSRCLHPAIILDSLGTVVLESNEYVSIGGVAFRGDTVHLLAPRSPSTYPVEVVLDSWDLATGTLLASRSLYVAESRGDLGGDVAISLDGKRAYVPTEAGFWIVNLESGNVRAIGDPWQAPISYRGQYKLVGSGSRNLMYGYHENGNLTTWLLPEPVRSD